MSTDIPKVQLTLSIDADEVKHYALIYLLLEDNSDDNWLWWARGGEIVSTWRFLSERVIEDCTNSESWNRIDDALTKLRVLWEDYNKSWIDSATPDDEATS
jgi:hypothetical protein